MLQQCLPLAVLKRLAPSMSIPTEAYVATVPTACGIETINTRASLFNLIRGELQQCLPLAVLKPKETLKDDVGIDSCNSAYRLRY